MTLSCLSTYGTVKFSLIALITVRFSKPNRICNILIYFIWTFTSTFISSFYSIRWFIMSLRVLYRYHYYGIGVKETSKYYELIYSRKGIQRYWFCIFARSYRNIAAALFGHSLVCCAAEALCLSTGLFSPWCIVVIPEQKEIWPESWNRNPDSSYSINELPTVS